MLFLEIWEDEMHAYLLWIGLLIPTSAFGAGPQPFYTAYFEAFPVVRLTIASQFASTDSHFDFDVKIQMDERSSDGTILYRDPASHLARVRCTSPAEILVGGSVYPVGATTGLRAEADWKDSLWRVLCNAPTS